MHLKELTNQLAAAGGFDDTLAVAANAAAALVTGGRAVAAAYDPASAGWCVQAAGGPPAEVAALAARLRAILPSPPAQQESRRPGRTEEGPSNFSSLPKVADVVPGANVTTVDAALELDGRAVGVVGVVLPHRRSPGWPNGAAARPAAQMAAVERDLEIIAAHTELALLAVGRATRLAECDRRQREHHEFLSIASHDLRTPLASIRGYTQLLLRQRDVSYTAVQRTSLETIIQQTDRLAGLTDVLLDVARIQTRRMALRLAMVDVGQVVRQAASGVQSQPGGPAISLLGPTSGPLLRADAQRLLQIAQALLDFATQRTAAGQLVEVRLTADAGGVRLAVDDPGPVLDPGERSRLFEQLTTAAGEGGSYAPGPVALYIARGAAEAHGGWVWAESPIPDRDSGARLSVWLPAAATE
ncbi:MAG: sensor histidine kinase [Chloroflexota bacterium]